MRHQLYEQLKERALTNGVTIGSEVEVNQLFELIDESVRAFPFDAEAQENYLHQLFMQYSEDERQVISDTECGLRNLFTNDNEYQYFSANKGGIIYGADDSLYIDFGSWFLCRGTEMVSRFLSEGTEAIIDYIKENNIPSSEYEYEALAYAFLEDDDSFI